MGPPWPDCIFIRTDFLVQNIQCVNTVFFLKCICTRLNEALEDGDYDTASDLQIEISKKGEALEKEYYE